MNICINILVISNVTICLNILAAEKEKKANSYILKKKHAELSKLIPLIV